MAEQLQHLIDRIQKEGVDKAEQQAEAIVERAESRAAGLIADAEKQAADTLARAETDSKVFAERSIQTIEQAARDLILTIGGAIEKLVGETLNQAVDASLSGKDFGELLARVIEAYAAQSGGGSLEVFLGEEDKKAFEKQVHDALQKKAGEGVSIHAEPVLQKGFRVSLDGGRVSHDFSREAIAEALMNLLRPQLAEIVQRAAREPANASGAAAE